MSASEQSQGAGTPEEPSAEEGATLEGLGELLSLSEPDDNTPGGDDDKGAESDGSQETKPSKFNDLAGAVGMELDALYKLEVQLDDEDEPVTVEQLKDRYKEARDLDLRVLEFEETRTEQQNEIARASAELKEILQALPAKAVNAEVLEKIRTRSQEAAKAERAATLDVIPSWKDEDARSSDIAAMSAHLQAYGFPVNQLESLVDHRWQRYVRDNMLREKRVKEALAKVRSAKPDKSGNAPAKGNAPKKHRTSVEPKKGESRLEAFFNSVD